METLLERLVATGSSIAVIDITGVPTVDTLVAQHLLKTVAAAQLDGCRLHHQRHPPADRADHRAPRHRSVGGRDQGQSVGRLCPGIEAAGTDGGHPSPPPREDKPVDRVPILRLGDCLLVTVQVDMHDELAMTLQDDLTNKIVATKARGVLIDISALEMVDSFIGRMLGNIAAMSRILDAQTVVVGMQPAVAITLVELGLSLPGIRTALNVDAGLALLRKVLDHER